MVARQVGTSACPVQVGGVVCVHGGRANKVMGQELVGVPVQYNELGRQTSHAMPGE